MHAARDRYEAIEITATYRAALVFCGDGDLERVLDGLGALRREPDEASDEAAQR